MKKLFSALAALGAMTVVTLGLTAGVASAHNATLNYDCFTVRANYTNFSAGANTATITINGIAHDVSFTGPNGSASVPFVSHSGDPDIHVSTTFISGDGLPKTISATFTADSCAPPPTTAPPTTTPATTTIPTNVAPEVVTRPAAAPVAAAAVVASPVFTG
jgi:hypothetical protein